MVPSLASNGTWPKIKLAAIFFVVANAQDFFARSYPRARLVHTVFEQGAHTGFTCLTTDDLRCFPLERQFANGGIHAQHFVNAEPASIAALVAVGTTYTAKERRGLDALNG